ncbi:MAG: NUDIX domain-containing protein [Methanosarcina sp.]|jgi:8-oxo-dGTP diphosphatase|uniref:NUDIX domain-containing protein n=1 Tax=Methanosarcina sp. TaxID=2213 RepID=UPI003BB6A3C6
MSIKKRRRGTAIVETPGGILVVSGRGEMYILPGGGANSGESRTEAAIRELEEETGLIATDIRFLFRHVGCVHKSYSGGFFEDHHTVCLIRASGIARPQNEVRCVGYYSPNSKIKISRTTKEIIDRFYEFKRTIH